MYKKCTKCKLEKRIEEFYFKNKALNKRRAACKVCIDILTDKSGKERRKRPEVKARKKEYNSKYFKEHGKQYYKTPAGAAVYICTKTRFRAKKEGLPFDLTPEYILSLLPDPFVCPVLGIKLERGSGNSHNASPTLDRIKPELGYVMGNVAIISNRANRIKSDATANEVQKVADWLKNYIHTSSQEDKNGTEHK